MKIPPPNCPHGCGARFGSHLRLDQHLRFECPALGRGGRGDADDRAAAHDDATAHDAWLDALEHA